MFMLCICCKTLCAQTHNWQKALYPISLVQLTTIKFIWIIRAVIINITHPGLRDAPSIITTKLILTTGLNSYAKKWTKHVHCTNKCYYSNYFGKVLVTHARAHCLPGITRSIQIMTSLLMHKNQARGFVSVLQIICLLSPRSAYHWQSKINLQNFIQQ